MKQKKYFIANWKMYLDSNASIAFATEHYDELIKLANHPDISLTFCPSFEVLHPLAIIFSKTNVSIGAQDCSEHKNGAYTGQISASTLKTLGCSYSIIGHSERRIHNQETNETVLQKCIRLLEQAVSPIVCIGENLQESQSGKTFTILEEQLKDIFSYLSKQQQTLQNLPILFAYEPLWAIGTGNIPSRDHLETVFAWLANKLQKLAINLPHGFLYGGSVNAQSVQELANIPDINGFLIGGASLNFQELKKIVYYTNQKVNKS